MMSFKQTLAVRVQFQKYKMLNITVLAQIE